MGTVTIGFTQGSPREKNVCASELGKRLEKIQGVTVERIRENRDTMDLGSTLQVILSSGAALAVARGIVTYLTANAKAEVQVEDKTRGLSVRVKNVTGKKAEAVIQEITKVLEKPAN